MTRHELENTTKRRKFVVIIEGKQQAQSKRCRVTCPNIAGPISGCARPLYVYLYIQLWDTHKSHIKTPRTTTLSLPHSTQTMSRSIPPTFNPHGNHYFTSSVASPPSPHPYYRGENAHIPLPSSHTTSPTSILNLNGQMSAPRLSAASSASSSTQYQPTVVHAPQPRPSSRPIQSSTSMPIFTPFRPDKSSPDLSDVLSKKKSASAWPAQPVFVQSSPKPKKP